MANRQWWPIGMMVSRHNGQWEQYKISDAAFLSIFHRQTDREMDICYSKGILCNWKHPSQGHQKLKIGLNRNFFGTHSSWQENLLHIPFIQCILFIDIYPQLHKLGMYWMVKRGGLNKPGTIWKTRLVTLNLDTTWWITYVIIMK